MFVSDLDRPWTDTPFLLQGFLIEDAEQLAQLREHCQVVTVDYGRSAGFENLAKPRFQNKPTAPTQRSERRVVISQVQKPAPIRKPRVTSEQTAREYAEMQGPVVVEGWLPQSISNFFGLSSGERKERLNDSVGSIESKARTAVETASEAAPGVGIIDRVKNMFAGSSEPKLATSIGGLPPEIAKPRQTAQNELETLRVNVYVDKTTVQEELAPARAAYGKTTEVMKSVLERIKLGQKFEVNEIDGPVYDMVESILRNPDALMWVARMRERDDATCAQALKTSVALVTFGRHLGFPQARMLHLAKAGLFLDVGKLKLPECILKKPARLSAAEFDEVKRHVEYSLNMLGTAADTHGDVLEAIEQHHERQDGSGYPRKLVGDQISVIGRMAGIVDTFTALTSSRPHVDMVSAYDAMRQLSSWRGQIFHEALVEQFIQSIGAFPAGSLVELSSGEVAVVVGHNKTRRLRPKVLIVLDESKQRLARPLNVDLLNYFRDGDSIYIRRGLPAGAYDIDERELYVS